MDSSRVTAQGLRLISVTPSRLPLSLPPQLSPPSFQKKKKTISSLGLDGADWASGGAIRDVFAQPVAGDEHPPGMPRPSLSFCRARRSTPNRNKTICIRI